MKDNEEFEMLLNEIPNVTSFNLHHHQQHHHHTHHQHQQQHPYVYNHVHGYNPTNGVVNGLVNGDFLSSNQKYMYVSPVSEVPLQTEGYFLDTMNNLVPWSQSICRMCVGNDAPNDLNGDTGNFFSGHGRNMCPLPDRLMTFDEGRRSTLLNLQQGCQIDRLSGLCLSPDQLNSMLSNLGFVSHQQKVDLLTTVTLGNLQFQVNGDFTRNQAPNIIPSVSRPSISNNFIYGNQNDLPIANTMVESTPNSWACQSLDARSCEHSLVIEGKNLNPVSKPREQKQHYTNTGLGLRGIMDCEKSPSRKSYRPFLLPPKYTSLLDVQGFIYHMAKDQLGCRFLQRKFDEGTPQDVQLIFNEVFDHVVELMMNSFGNYLIQKLLEVCNEEQRMQILVRVTSEPGKLVNISLNTHGTRVVQKIIETLKTRQQFSLIITALAPGFLLLIEDLNGNHVIQRCLQCFSNEDNKFIFNAAEKYCFDIATHRHGCCVLQRCIGHSTGQQRENLAVKIASKGCTLAKHPFGNYVIQYIVELKIPSATAKLISQFEGNYVELAEQKFSSNVVEKCLKVFNEENQSKIIHELLSNPKFGQLLQDPFANYVIQSALEVSKGRLHAILVEAIRPHAAALRTSPFCKRIFSKSILKK